jgi:hypothetical protein
VREVVAKLAGQPSANEMEFKNKKWGALANGIAPGASETAIFGSTLARAYQTKGNVIWAVVKDLTGFSGEGERAGSSSLLGISEAATVKSVLAVSRALYAWYSANSALEEKYNSPKGQKIDSESAYGAYGIELVEQKKENARKLVEDLAYALADGSVLKILGGGIISNPLIAIPSAMAMEEGYWQAAYETVQNARGDKPTGTFATPIHANLQAWGLEEYYGAKGFAVDGWIATLLEAGVIKSLDDAKELEKNMAPVYNWMENQDKQPLPENVITTDEARARQQRERFQKKIDGKK